MNEALSDDLNEDLQNTPSNAAIMQEWIKETAIDRAILTPQASSLKLQVTVPKLAKKLVGVLIRNKEGEAVVIKRTGEPLWDMMELEVPDGYETLEINLPGQQIFNIDLTSSYLSERDKVAIRSAQALYADLQLQTLKGNDKTSDMYYLYTRIMSVVDTAKGENGRTAELAKTTINKGTSERSIIQRYKEEEKKRSWIPGKR